MAIRADQVGSSGAFGAIPVFLGTLLISTIAMLVAVPIGLMSAIYLAEYANRRFRDVAKPLL
ncbi:MAG: phosphate ABC transporter permease subunit PstC, partial [Syntrophobacteria bacterium]